MICFNLTIVKVSQKLCDSKTTLVTLKEVLLCSLLKECLYTLKIDLGMKTAQMGTR
jgi:hypothetical protein